jgi:hypothetical protein
MNTLRDQIRSLRIEKAVLGSFFKSLPGALMCCLRQQRFVSSHADHLWENDR